jgi:hypothetical protein
MMLEEQSQRVSPRTPRPQHWMNLAVGRSGCRLTARVSSRNEIIAVDLGLNDREDAVPLFKLLKQDRQQVEAEIGEVLNWRLKPNKKECAIEIEWENEDPTDRARWSEQHELLVDMLDRFHAAFSPRLKRLKPADYEEPALDEAGPGEEKPKAFNVSSGDFA